MKKRWVRIAGVMLAAVTVLAGVPGSSVLPGVVEAQAQTEKARWQFDPLHLKSPEEQKQTETKEPAAGTGGPQAAGTGAGSAQGAGTGTDGTQAAGGAQNTGTGADGTQAAGTSTGTGTGDAQGTGTGTGEKQGTGTGTGDAQGTGAGTGEKQESGTGTGEKQESGQDAKEALESGADAGEKDAADDASEQELSLVVQDAKGKELKKIKDGGTLSVATSDKKCYFQLLADGKAAADQKWKSSDLDVASFKKAGKGTLTIEDCGDVTVSVEAGGASYSFKLNIVEIEEKFTLDLGASANLAEEIDCFEKASYAGKGKDTAYFKLTSKGKITTKETLKQLVSPQKIEISLKNGIKKYPMEVGLSVAPPKVQIIYTQVTLTGNGEAAVKYQFKFNLAKYAPKEKGKRNLVVTLNGSQNKELAKKKNQSLKTYVNKEKGTSTTYVTLRKKELKNWKGNLEFQIEAQYGKNRSRTGKITISKKSTAGSKTLVETT